MALIYIKVNKHIHDELAIAVISLFSQRLYCPFAYCTFYHNIYMREAQVYATPLAAVVAYILAVHSQRTWRP